MATIDYSLPVSTVLRESTRQAHKDVEHSAGAAALVNGVLPKEEYIRFLMILWHVYDAFEQALDRHCTHPVLEPTHNPQLLARAPSLESDIAHLLDVPQSEWKAHPIFIALNDDPPPALVDYVTRIEELADSDDPAPLLAHAYVRYLGDLSGGQTIKRTLAKAYGLDEAQESGLSFFAFRDHESTRVAGQGDLKRIKVWFRAGMDKGVGDDVKVKAAIVDEANQVFLLNKQIFDAIEISHKELSDKPSKVVYQAPSTDGGYSVASVVTVIVAVSLAHFLLVVGGFTGARGSAKILTFYEWIDKLFRR